MSTSPIPALRVNNLNGRSRSRSPPPAANPTIPNTYSTSTNTRTNLLYPDLLRTRRSTSSENDVFTEKIPLKGADNTEIIDLGDDRDVASEPYPGVDDGFFSTRANEDGPVIPDKDAEPVDGTDDRKVVPSRGPSPRPFPFPDFELGGGTDIDSIPDVNVYQHKKTLAQGMMDLALFSANANQLRYVLDSDQHPYYYPGIILISISLIFQVLIGVGLLWNSRYNVKDKKEICIANKINNFTIIGIFLVTVVNVFTCAFGVASVQPVASTPSSSP